LRYEQGRQRVYAAVYNGTTNPIFNPIVETFGITTNTWHQIIAVFEFSTGNLALYHNGILVSEQDGALTSIKNISGKDISNSSSVGINHRLNVAGGSNIIPFKGSFGAIRIYNKALALNEVTQNYNVTAPRFTPINISQTNLIVHLDASNEVSYPGTGSTWTDLARNNNATITGATFRTNNGGIFDLDGVNDEIVINHNSTLSFNNTSLKSFQVWVNFDILPTSAKPIIIKDSASFNADGYALYLLTDGKIRITTNGSSVLSTTSNATVAINTWYLITVVSQSSSVLNSTSVYLNQTRIIGTAHDVGTITESNDLKIGSDYYGNFLDAKIGSFAFYDRALTEAEIIKSYNDTSPRFLYTTYLRADTYLGGDIINAGSRVGDNNGIMDEDISPAFDSEKKNFIFNGSSQNQIKINDHASIEPGSGSFSLEVWFKYNGLNSPIGSQVIVGKFSNGGASQHVSYSIRINSTSNIFAQFGSGSGSGANLVVNSSNYQLMPGQWYHFIYVFTNGGTKTIQTFINGESEGVIVNHSLSSILNHSFPLYIGSYNGGEYSQPFNGLLREFRYYNAALTSAQVTSIYANRNQYID
jgi:hypothetical protein